MNNQVEGSRERVSDGEFRHYVFDASEVLAEAQRLLQQVGYELKPTCYIGLVQHDFRAKRKTENGTFEIVGIVRENIDQAVEGLTQLAAIRAVKQEADCVLVLPPINEYLLIEFLMEEKGRWYFGMKAHVGTDTRRGLVHSIVVTNAAVHDSRVMDELLHGEETSVYGDKAYTGEERKAEYEANGIGWCVHRKARRGQRLTPEDEDYNHRQSRVRAKGEHAFRVVKHLWRYRKVRYKGLYKNAVQVFSLFTLANLYLVRHELRMQGV